MSLIVAAGAKEGILLTIALTIELLFLSLSVSTTLGQDQASRGRVITTTVGIALLLPLGAIILPPNNCPYLALMG